MFAAGGGVGTTGLGKGITIDGSGVGVGVGEAVGDGVGDGLTASTLMHCPSLSVSSSAHFSTQIQFLTNFKFLF